MSTNARDTHFAGFAKLLTQELEEYIEWSNDREKVCQIIAKRAYDLVAHTIDETGVQQYDPATGRESATIDEVIQHIPDMTAWPESE